MHKYLRMLLNATVAISVRSSVFTIYKVIHMKCYKTLISTFLN